MLNYMIIILKVKVTKEVDKKMVEWKVVAEEEEYHQGKGTKNKSATWILVINLKLLVAYLQ